MGPKEQEIDGRYNLYIFMEINITDFLAISIVGVALSLLIEVIQAKFATRKNLTKLITIALAIAVGSVYYFVRETSYWQTILGVLTAASTVYAFFFSNKKSTSENDIDSDIDAN